MQAIPCKDHMGNEFPSKTAMCKHYGISTTSFEKRMNEMHMSLEETLTTPVRKQKTGSCKDHLGNEFPNKKAMCKHYGISYDTFDKRKNDSNMPIKDALTKPTRKQHNGPCKDHLGNEFPSKKAMCEHYGISESTFSDRIKKRHMSLEETLTTPVEKQHKGPCKDHLGNEFPNKQAMCEHYSISKGAFEARIYKQHMSLKEALTTPVKKRKKGSCKDHLGNEFPSKTAMLDYYGVNPTTFDKRINDSHMSLKDALTKQQTTYKDHLGNEFPSMSSMCKHYGISHETFKHRRNKKHMSLKDALTKPTRKKQKDICKDHLGNEFPNKKAICKHYGISISAFNYRVNKKHIDLEKALTTPVKNKHKGSCRDHLGNEFPSKKAMCVHYNISYDIFKERTKNSIEEALGIIPYICFKTKNARITDNLFIKEVKAIHNKMIYAVCVYNDTETLLTHDEIIEIYRSETRNAP